MQATPQPLSFGLVVRRGLALGLLGVLIITLAGPAAVVAGFAVVGYVGYRAFRFLWFGEKPPEWSKVVAVGQTVFTGLFRVIRWPVRKLWGGTVFLARLAGGTLGLAWGVTGETLSGALLGAAAGVAVGWPTNMDHLLVGLGAGGGALTGLWIGIENFRRSRSLAARQAALEASLS